jgi:hypothetical protein
VRLNPFEQDLFHPENDFYCRSAHSKDDLTLVPDRPLFRKLDSVRSRSKARRVTAYVIRYYVHIRS